MEHESRLQVANPGDQRGPNTSLSDPQSLSSSNIGVAYRFVSPIPAPSQKVQRVPQQPFGFVLGPSAGSAAQAFTSCQMPSDSIVLPRSSSMNFEYSTYPAMFGFPSEMSAVPLHFPFPVMNHPVGTTFIPVPFPSYPQPRFHFPQRFVYPTNPSGISSNNLVSSALPHATSHAEFYGRSNPEKILPVFDSDDSDEIPQDLSFRSDVSVGVPGSSQSFLQRVPIDERNEPNSQFNSEMDLVAERWSQSNSFDDEDCADVISSVKRLRSVRDTDYVQVRAVLVNSIEDPKEPLNQQSLKVVPDELLSSFGLMTKPLKTRSIEVSETPVESSDIDHHYLRNYQYSLCTEDDGALIVPLTDGPDENLLHMVGLMAKETSQSTDLSAFKMSKRKRLKKSVDADDNHNHNREEKARRELRERLQVTLASVEDGIMKLKNKAVALRQLAKDEAEGDIVTVPAFLARLERILSEL